VATFIPDITNAATGNMLKTRWSQNRFSKGAYTNFQPGQFTRYGDLTWVESDNPEEGQEVGFGNLIFAAEQVSDTYYGFMNGGAQTGRLAAETDMRSMSNVVVDGISDY
jgi:monoamine oxidase